MHLADKRALLDLLCGSAWSERDAMRCDVKRAGRDWNYSIMCHRVASHLCGSTFCASCSYNSAAIIYDALARTGRCGGQLPDNCVPDKWAPDAIRVSGACVPPKRQATTVRCRLRIPLHFTIKITRAVGQDVRVLAVVHCTRRANGRPSVMVMVMVMVATDHTQISLSTCSVLSLWQTIRK